MAEIKRLARRTWLKVAGSGIRGFGCGFAGLRHLVPKVDDDQGGDLPHAEDTKRGVGQSFH